MSKRFNSVLTSDRGSDIAWSRIFVRAKTEPIDNAMDELFRRLRPHFEDGMRQQLFSQVLANALDTP